MKEKRWNITGLMALTVFEVFALCVVLVLLSGAQVYRGLTERGEENFSSHTAACYLTTRIRQAESVTVGDFEGCHALIIPEQIDGTTYLTRVYVYDGYLRELYCAENADLQPQDGEKVLPAEVLEVTLRDGLLTMELDGQMLFLDLTGKEAAP